MSNQTPNPFDPNSYLMLETWGRDSNLATSPAPTYIESGNVWSPSTAFFQMAEGQSYLGLFPSATTLVAIDVSEVITDVLTHIRFTASNNNISLVLRSDTVEVSAVTQGRGMEVRIRDDSANTGFLKMRIRRYDGANGFVDLLPEVTTDVASVLNTVYPLQIGLRNNVITVGIDGFTASAQVDDTHAEFSHTLGLQTGSSGGSHCFALRVK